MGLPEPLNTRPKITEILFHKQINNGNFKNYFTHVISVCIPDGYSVVIGGMPLLPSLGQTTSKNTELSIFEIFLKGHQLKSLVLGALNADKMLDYCTDKKFTPLVTWKITSYTLLLSNLQQQLIKTELTQHVL